MTIATLEQFKEFIRELSSDLDPAIAIAIAGAQSEMDGFIGGDPSGERWPNSEDVPGDVKAAGLINSRNYWAEAAVNRVAADSLRDREEAA